MSLTLTLTGTGGAQGVPAWGCECAACDRARRSPQYRRQPCSGVVKFNDAITLIDAGLLQSRRSLVARIVPAVFADALSYGSRPGAVSAALGRWRSDSRFTARRMTRVATICLNIRACLISATQWNRLWYLICRGCRSRRCRLTTQN